ncbi:MAG: DUF1987 domain-containing protein [Bacteroidales bacterium]|nr:DUF1987 domain-containing protein [Bacteroidales bacterium]HPD94246.1 DUF1987 domain-containing protein [Tenuifilaceae bacterium]HRX30295.1 DUF1987 domain-containing protein [Tenuifilaceae bacterium]
MEKLEIESTTETPKVLLDKEKSIIEFAGNSLPEDVTSFYNPILEWIDTYVENPNAKTLIDMSFDYYNTSSSKMILKILEKFREIHRKGYEVQVNWHYMDDDEDMIEAGEDYAEHLKIPFKLIPIQH